MDFQRISKEEHDSKYLVQDYLDNRQRTFKSMMHEDFLSAEEIEIFNYEVTQIVNSDKKTFDQGFNQIIRHNSSIGPSPMEIEENGLIL